MLYRSKFSSWASLADQPHLDENLQRKDSGAGSGGEVIPEDGNGDPSSDPSDESDAHSAANFSSHKEYTELQSEDEQVYTSGSDNFSELDEVTESELEEAGEPVAAEPVAGEPAAAAAASSSMPDQVDPGPGDDVVPGPERVLVGPKDMHPDTVVIPEYGEIKFYKKNDTMTAHCHVHGGPGDLCCRRSRTVKGSEFRSRAGQGRPVGLLICWLKDTDHHDTLPKTYVHKLEDRKAAREWFKSLPGSSGFLTHERPKGVNEEEEPVSIP